MTQMLEDSIDMIKTEGGDAKVILVGGGSILFPEKSTSLKGISEIHIPKYFGCANAYGASISQISDDLI